jgi:ribonuclease E
MVKRMLIDGTHSEETRVVVMNGTRLEDFDVETSTKKQIKGNIYLAKVIRVEPSLQAAFVDYGGNRHGFLAFSEIHPDYYQIPVADREKLMAEVEDDHDHHDDADTKAENGDTDGNKASASPDKTDTPAAASAEVEDAVSTDVSAETPETDDTASSAAQTEQEPASATNDDNHHHDAPVEQVGGEDPVESSSRRVKPYRQYKIQEVIKRKQILLIQVVKEERGNKGAALTTYLSLAGRYCVLMPNTPRGGGVSRKITSVTDRRRLKDMMSGLDIPKGMAVIVRTAGSERSKTEIKRDYEYLLRTWSGIRNLTMASRAPALIYEEATLIKRAIRDLYTRDIDEILVEGDEGYRMAKDFMKALTPSHAKKVQPYRDSNHMPLFHRYQVENQLEALHNKEVHLKSGGYIVMQQTEALVSIDVNSGRSTRERNIEETALKTNLEAADEIARQLRLRDLAGLVVIDYIDMEDAKNNAAVERRTKDALRSDRARIQVGRISPFGLMELSRQRLRPSFMESSYITCPHCSGEGVIRSTESEVIRILRVIEEEGVRRRSAEITVTTPTNIALYLLNQKRAALTEIEARYGFTVVISGSDTMGLGELVLDRTRALTKAESEALIVPITSDPIPEPEVIDEGTEEEPKDHEHQDDSASEADDDDDASRKKRRRRKRRTKRSDNETETSSTTLDLNENGTVTVSDDDGDDIVDKSMLPHSLQHATSEEDQPKKPRRRGRRGGRRRNRNTTDEGQTVEQINEILEQAAKSEGDEDPVITAFIAEQEALATAPEAEHDATDRPERKPRRSRKSPRTRRNRQADDQDTATTEAATASLETVSTNATETSIPTEAPTDASAPTVVEPTAKAEAKVIPIVTIDTSPDAPLRHTLTESAPLPVDIAAPARQEPVLELAEATTNSAPMQQVDEVIKSISPRKGWWSR